MVSDAGAVTANDITYFLTIAAIGGTLLGLTFIALSFFLVDLLKRYDSTALPVFRQRDGSRAAHRSKKLHPHASLTDFELLDGDPLVIFIASSVGVTWNLFLFPLTIGLTVAWVGARLPVLAGEMVAFFCFLTACFWKRNVKIDELRPYLTHEEPFWPFLGGIGLLLFASSTVIVLISALAETLPAAGYLAFWNRDGISNQYATLFLVRLISILALLLGTYTANKDMFIFFKTVAAERMRHRWLDVFMRERYPQLNERVVAALSRLAAETRIYDSLKYEWNGGWPANSITHDELKKAGKDFARSLWQEVVAHRSGAASWMLDVPKVADWAAQVEELLNKIESAERLE